MKLKRILFILLVCLILMPFVVDAKEACTIVSGNGKDIGSELACGSEHFYIIENKNDSIRMIAKYNLDMGYEYNKVVMSKERFEELKSLYNISTRQDFNSIKTEPEFSDYDMVRLCRFRAEQYSCMVYNYINNEVIKQSSKAIGAHGDTHGNPEFPEYGVVNLNTPNSETNLSYGGGYYADLNMHNFMLHEDDERDYYLSDYKEYLNSNNFEISDIDLISVKDINNIVKSLTKKELPLKDWWSRGWEKVEGNYYNYYWVIGSIKDYLPSNHDWLYSTTYWTKTVVPEEAGYGKSVYAYFVDTLGNLCSSEQCSISVGAGIRPVIEINKKNIKYSIKTKTDGNGTIEVLENAYGGDLIQFKVSAKRGLKLVGLTITTDSGEKIELREADIITDSSGVVSISKNLFTMPYENVTIEARWDSSIINPNTGVYSYILIVVILLIISISLYVILIRKKHIKIRNAGRF